MCLIDRKITSITHNFAAPARTRSIVIMVHSLGYSGTLYTNNFTSIKSPKWPPMFFGPILWGHSVVVVVVVVVDIDAQAACDSSDTS